MKQMFCAIFLFIFVDDVISTYGSNAYNNPWYNNRIHHGSNYIEAADTPHTECPPGFSGQLPYAMDCRQYLNCWHGRGSIQSCAPGTMFNPQTKECDNPSKVRCRPFAGFPSNQYQAQPATRSQVPYFQRQEHAPVRCEPGASGLAAHPFDCSKFLNCDHGRTFIQDCGPGTMFNDVFKVCDWPHKVNCGSRNPGASGNTEILLEHTHGDYGEGVMDVRFSPESRAHAAPFPPHNAHNRPQSNDHTQNTQTNSFSSVDVSPLPSSISVQTVKPPLAPEQPPIEPSPKNEFVQIPSLDLLPPFKDPQANNATVPNNRTSRVGFNATTQVPFAEWTRDQIETDFLDTINRDVHTVQKPTEPSNSLDTSVEDQPPVTGAGGNQPSNSNSNPNPQAYPEINYMSPRIADDFRKYFANPHESPTTPVPLATTESSQVQGLDYMTPRIADDFKKHFANPRPKSTTPRPSLTTTPKVHSIYPSGFEVVGQKCEETGWGLSEHPYDCSRFVSCESGKMRVLTCKNGFLFNPALKMCDFAQNVNNCKSTTSRVNPTGVEPAPDDAVNEIHDDDRNTKAFDLDTTTPTVLHVTQATPTSSSSFFIPDMSVLPLESENLPRKTYPEEYSPAFNGFGQPSRGGDIQPDTLDGGTFGSNGGFNNRDGKGLFHGEQPPTVEAPVVATTESKNVMRIPVGKEHVMPIYHRPTKPTPATTSVRTPKEVRPQQSFNHIYYQPFTDAQNIPTEKDETDYVPISEALKYLLRPYLNKNDTNTVNNTETEHMNKIEGKLLDIFDNGQNHTKALEQDSLASAVLNDNVAVKNLPESPRFDARTDAETTNGQSHDHNSNAHLPPGYQQSHKFHPQPHQTYYKPATNDPVPIAFPGPHSQSHLMHGHNRHSPPTATFHSSSPPPPTHSSHYHNGHQAHYGPNYHSNAPNYDLAYNKRHVDATTQGTASAPLPNVIRTEERSTIPVRFGGEQYGEITTCYGQFDCGTGFCIPFSQLCDGYDNCGNRNDESNCPHVNYQVRLSNDKGHKHMGRVEVKAFGRWGYVCDDKFTLTNANVLCRELGFNMGAAEVKPNSFFSANSNMPTGDNMFQMDEVSCQGNETSLKDCAFNGWGISDCNADEVVGVVCKVTVMQCPPNHWLCQESEECIPMSFMCDGLKDCGDGSDESSMHCDAKIEYRLMDGTDLEGRVEVKYRGVWGTVCDDDFGDKEATVFCNSLGFTGPATVVQRRHGMSTGPIWLDQVDCLGNETSLDKCMHFDWSESNCNHTEDVSVRCSYGSDSKSSRYISNDNALQRFTASRETHDYLREAPRDAKSIPDFSNMCGRVKVTDAEELEESIGQFRVISGSRTKRGHHPWQATIRARGRNGRSSHWCGAVVIGKNHILTAAHCLIGFPKGAYFIRMGDHHSEIREDSEIEIFIENWHIHEEFRKGQLMNNDIAVVQLKHPIQFTNYIQPICLPDANTKYEAGKNCTISGWGSIQYGKSTPSLELKAAAVPLIAQEVCRQPDIYGDQIMDTMFCAGFLDQSGVDACDGDSGGPLVCAEEDGAHVLYGIISWGQRCGDSTKPGVYVKVQQYMDWIKEKMNLLS